jgi:hypothetical protein
VLAVHDTPTKYSWMVEHGYYLLSLIWPFAEKVDLPLMPLSKMKLPTSDMGRAQVYDLERMLDGTATGRIGDCNIISIEHR